MTKTIDATEDVDPRAVEAARRVAQAWLTRAWARPSISAIAPAARVLEAAGVELTPPSPHPLTRASWELLVAALGAHPEAFIEALATLASADAKLATDLAMQAAARARPEVAEACARELFGRGLEGPVHRLLPRLRHANDPTLAERVLASMDLERPRGAHLCSLADALLGARDLEQPWPLVESAWATLVERAPATVAAAGSQGAPRWRDYFDQQLRVLARRDLDAAVELLEELRGWVGLGGLDCLGAVLGRLVRVDPSRAWELIKAEDGEGLSAALGAASVGGPLPPPAVERLAAHLGELDCVSEWDHWLDPLMTATCDSQLPLVRRELARPELAEVERLGATALALASAVGLLRSRDRQAGLELFDHLEPLVEQDTRDRFRVAALAPTALPRTPS